MTYISLREYYKSPNEKPLLQLDVPGCFDTLNLQTFMGSLTHPEVIVSQNGYKIYVQLLIQTIDCISGFPVTLSDLKQWNIMFVLVDKEGNIYNCYSSDAVPSEYPSVSAFDGGSISFYTDTTKILTLDFLGTRINDDASASPSPFYNYLTDSSLQAEFTNPLLNHYFSLTFDNWIDAFNETFTIRLIFNANQTDLCQQCISVDFGKFGISTVKFDERS